MVFLTLAITPLTLHYFHPDHHCTYTITGTTFFSLGVVPRSYCTAFFFALYSKHTFPDQFHFDACIPLAYAITCIHTHLPLSLVSSPLLLSLLSHYRTSTTTCIYTTATIMKTTNYYRLNAVLLNGTCTSIPELVTSIIPITTATI